MEHIPISEDLLKKIGATEWKHPRFRKFKIGYLMYGSKDNLKTLELTNLHMKPITNFKELYAFHKAVTGEELTLSSQ